MQLVPRKKITPRPTPATVIGPPQADRQRAAMPRCGGSNAVARAVASSAMAIAFGAAAESKRRLRCSISPPRAPYSYLVGRWHGRRRVVSRLSLSVWPSPKAAQKKGPEAAVAMLILTSLGERTTAPWSAERRGPAYAPTDHTPHAALSLTASRHKETSTSLHRPQSQPDEMQAKPG